MKYGVCGLGSIGKRHLDLAIKMNANGRFKEIAGFDTRHDRLDEANQDGVTLYQDFGDFARDLDFAIICVPTSKHIPVINRMLEHSTPHLFIEKPLSHSLAGCDELEFSYLRNAKTVMVGYLLRFHPIINRLKQLIDSGVCGNILTVRAESGFYLPYWHPWEDYRDFYMSWKAGGGGALLDTSHEINYLQYLFGEISEVNGFFGTVSDLEITSDDLVLFNCKFASGLRGEIHLDLLQFEESRYCKLVGSEAVVHADLVSNKLSTYAKSEKAWSVEEIPVDFDKIYLDELEHFVDVALNGGEVRSPISQARDTMGVIEAVRRSTENGQSIRLPIY